MESDRKARKTESYITMACNYRLWLKCLYKGDNKKYDTLERSNHELCPCPSETPLLRYILVLRDGSFPFCWL